MAMLNLNFLDQKGGWIYEFGVQERTRTKNQERRLSSRKMREWKNPDPGVLTFSSHFQGTVTVFVPRFGTIASMFFCHLLCVDVRLLAL